MHHALHTIEKESDLVGKIVRPLSAALLPETDPEKDGLIKRENLGMIKGRTRRNQLDAWQKNMELKIHQMQVVVVC